MIVNNVIIVTIEYELKCITILLVINKNNIDLMILNCYYHTYSVNVSFCFRLTLEYIIIILIICVFRF